LRRRSPSGRPGDLSLEVDVTDEQQVVDLFARVRSELGRIDVLFNNAGISPTDDASVLDTTLEAYERVQAANLRSVFLCCKHGIPHLLANDRPAARDQHRLVRRGDGAATSQISYTASKAASSPSAASSASSSPARRARQRAVPGPVDTPLLQELFANDPERAARRMVHIPIGRSRGRGDRRGRALPCLRRLELCHGVDVSGRRRHQRRLHDASIGHNRAAGRLRARMRLPPSGSARRDAGPATPARCFRRTIHPR